MNVSSPWVRPPSVYEKQLTALERIEEHLENIKAVLQDLQEGILEVLEAIPSSKVVRKPKRGAK
jgi:hypothetical protein